MGTTKILAPPLRSQIDVHELLPGDILSRSLIGTSIFRHYGCFAGRDWYGRHWVFEHTKDKRPELVLFEDFARGYEVRYERIKNAQRSFAMSRMRSLLDNPKKYDELGFNCEHATRFIAEGNPYSLQVQRTVILSAILLFISLVKE